MPQDNKPQAAAPGTPPGYRWLRRMLFILACLGTLLAGFYVEENWRGKRTWERAEKELRAMGARLDWKDFIPPPVPDDQNIFKAPNMQNWFVKGEPGELGMRLGAVATGGGKGPVRIAEVRVVSPGSGGTNAIRSGDPAAANQLEHVIRTVLGPSLDGARLAFICAQPLDRVQPAQVVLEADSAPSLAQLNSLLPPRANTFEACTMTFEAAGTNVFSLKMEFQHSWCAAADYLAATAEFEPDFDLLREALKRPCARMEGDYHKPYEVPIPNFVAMRRVAQTLSQRAQCYLLLGRGEAAARELVLVRDLCRLLEAPPDGKPMTLVAAMINVAITGLYTAVIQDGLRLGAWQEPQLKALQEQCARIDLLSPVYSSLEGERAAFCQMMATMKPSEFGNFFASLGNPKASLWQKLRDPEYLLISLVPHGWLFQNRATVAVLEQRFLDCYDLTNRLVFPDRCRSLQADFLDSFRRFSPKTFLAAVVVPNAVKATETTARNQTLAHQAQLACALERYRLTHGQLPESLEALAPHLVNPLPRDLIGGKPLHYRRTGAGEFVLYSIGWNASDDGGTQDGDWVWWGSRN